MADDALDHGHLGHRRPRRQHLEQVGRVSDSDRRIIHRCLHALAPNDVGKPDLRDVTFTRHLSVERTENSGKWTGSSG